MTVSPDTVSGDYGEAEALQVKHCAPASSFCAECPPVREEFLEHLHNDLDTSIGLNACVCAVADASFFGQICVGRLLSRSRLTILESIRRLTYSSTFPPLQTSPNIDQYVPSKHPLVLSLSPPSAKGTRKLHLPCTKTHQHKGDDVVLTHQESITDPIDAINHHLLVNQLSPSSPPFSYIDVLGEHRVLTKKLLLSVCNSVWAAHGIPCITGHSFRIRGTTHYLLNGVSPNVVAALGRWKSNAFLFYWRNLDSLASIHLHHHHSRSTYSNRLNMHHHG
ncbi:hypothetical protein BDP27DRAFT_1427091 [Rhodocollybia butyracea]|uniref:Tyr recombinase domain-containing protein n=1 Tax=Rhodocollybia butyracea TaxID=206335 RepID=A0A9P5PHC9_9AGAR|nr:hypothetical protein BDP27DRAFT_1427091 [Rhodocollybia butyracea]